MVLLYGRAGRLTAKTAIPGPGQYIDDVHALDAASERRGSFPFPLHTRGVNRPHPVPHRCCGPLRRTKSERRGSVSSVHLLQHLAAAVVPMANC
jgi:hypothetical protein